MAASRKLLRNPVYSSIQKTNGFARRVQIVGRMVEGSITRDEDEENGTGMGRAGPRLDAAPASGVVLELRYRFRSLWSAMVSPASQRDDHLTLMS